MLRFVSTSFIVVSAIQFATASFADEPPSQVRDRAILWPDGKLPRLTTSRVVGSPEPPLPFTSKRLYPQLKLNFPLAVAHQPGSDRLWVITLDGAEGATNLRRFVDTPDVAEAELLLASDGRVATDITFHPDFSNNGFVYVGHNRPTPPDGEKHSCISRFTVNPLPPFECDPKSEITIIEWPSDGHNGVAIAFGLDGTLFITTG